jgi:thiol-disulfide isomerase/thioredoxin
MMEGSAVIRARRGRALLTLAAAVCLIVSGSCTGDESGRQAEKGERIRRSTDVILTGLDGSTTTLSAFKGRVVVLSFWATWSKDCIELIDTMNALHRKFGDKAAILGIVMDAGSERAVRRFVDEHGIRYPVFVKGERVAQGLGGVGKLPTTLLYRKDGTLYERIRGNRKKRYYDERIVKLRGRHAREKAR